VSHLHSLQSYTFVTTITYYTLTHLHWLTSQLSITFSNYHRLYISTLRNSRRGLTPRIHFLRLLLNNLLVGLFLTNWLLRHFSSSYITLNRTSVTAATSQVRAVLPQVTVFTTRCLGNEHDAVWRHRGRLCNNARCSSAQHGTARRRHCFPCCCVACILSRGV
jgi:hypothetical protein